MPAGRWPRTDAVGRGALSNPPNRFDSQHVVPLDDGWEPGDEVPPAIETTVVPIATRSILTRNDSPDIGFDRSINPYKGCEHGCIYCFARPTHAYLGLSPGLDFESRIFSKPDAASLLRAELSRPSYRCERVILGANTDPYQPVERGLGITRSILEVLDEFEHPVSLITKSNLVLRDADILASMASRRLASVNVSITTLDRTLSRRMEPRAPTPERRLEAVRELTRAGVPVCVLAAPMIPALNDSELERILDAAKDAGAVSAGYVLVRLPLEIKDLFEDWLREAYPLRANHVLNLIRQTRGGKLYDPEWGKRMRGEGPIADLLAKRFEVAARRLGLDGGHEPLDTTRFRVPPRPGDQASLF